MTKTDLESQLAGASYYPRNADAKMGSGMWEIPDHIIDGIAGGTVGDFTQTGTGGTDFFQCSGCDFGQNIGDFSQGTPPRGWGEDEIKP